MIKHICSFVLLFSVATNTFACFTPISGEKYNELILVEQVENQNRFSFRIPLMVEDRQLSRVYLHFGIETPNGYGRSDEWVNVPFSAYDGLVVGEVWLDPSKTNPPFAQTGRFPLDKSKKYYPYLHIAWDTKSGGGCPIVGKSSYMGEYDV
jgi:hypothetical protein